MRSTVLDKITYGLPSAFKPAELNHDFSLLRNGIRRAHFIVEISKALSEWDEIRAKFATDPKNVVPLLMFLDRSPRRYKRTFFSNLASTVRFFSFGSTEINRLVFHNEELDKNQLFIVSGSLVTKPQGSVTAHGLLLLRFWNGCVCSSDNGQHTGADHDSGDIKVTAIRVLPNYHNEVHIATRNDHHMDHDSHAFNDWNRFIAVWNRDQRQEDF